MRFLVNIMSCRRVLTIALWVILVSWSMFPMRCAFCQGTSGPIVTDSKVGYIDVAIPGDVFRLRYDSSYGSNAPNRAEFIYAKGAPGGPGLPAPEPSVDFQDIWAYTEVILLPDFSAFLDVPVRFLNPDANLNTAGLSDLDVGFKYAFLTTDDAVWSFQWRTYLPTGDADRGLGTRHVSLEPSILFHQTLSERAGVDAEFRYWIPVGGTDFAGDVLRYGVGGHFDLFNDEQWRFGPVVEFVGWTALGGKQSIVDPFGVSLISDAAGQTVINSKIGMRLGVGDRVDVYGGWGRPLTDDRWYENTFRLELRWLL